MIQTTTINDLETGCLVKIFSCLTGKEGAVLSSVQKSWQAALQDDTIWKKICSDELLLEDPANAQGQLCQSYRDAYKSWRTAFGYRYGGYLIRALDAWKRIKDFLRQEFPQVLTSLRPGATEEEIAEAEEALGCKMPLSLAVLYRMHNGQNLEFDQMLDDRRLRPGTHIRGHPSIMYGLFGGYAFYHHLVSCRMLPLKRSIRMTKSLINQGELPEGPMAVFAMNFNMNKLLLVNLADGSMHTLSYSSNYVMPASAPDFVPSSCDGVLRWVEDYAGRLESGQYGVERLDPDEPWTRGISLFPRNAPALVECVTRGVRVRVSAVLVPEQCNDPMSGSEGGYFFAYRVSMQLLSAEEQREINGPESEGQRWRLLTSCQLRSRHWRQRDAQGNIVGEFQGEAVIGKHPILRPGKEFVYSSCTQQRGRFGTMSGEFRFVEGTMDSPQGQDFNVQCPTFTLQVPDYIF